MRRSLLAIGVVSTLLAAIGCATPTTDDASDRGGTSDPELRARVEAYLRPWIERGDFRGVVWISRGDDVLVEDAWGLEEHVDTRPGEAVFRLASITKTITGGAILMEIGAGRLALDDTLDRFVPSVDGSERITVEHLLAHASGVGAPHDSVYLREQVTLDELVAAIAAQSPLFEPGSEHRYSNAGYNLLAEVLEQVSGRGYEDHLRAAIFEPLGMDATGQYLDADVERVVPGMRPGPGPGGVRPAGRIHFGAATGSGSLASSAADLHRWALTVAREDLFSYEGLMWPFGWGKIEAGGEQGLEQTGAMAGATSSIVVLPESETVVVVLNAVEAADWTRWSRDLTAIATGDVVDPPEVPRASDRSVDAERLVGTYRDGDTTVRVAVGDGLETFRDGWPYGHWLMPLDDGTFLSRATGAHVRFEPDRGPARRMIQRWGDDEQVLERD